MLIVTTEKPDESEHYHTRLDMAGRLACDHRGYLCQVPADSSSETVWQLLEPVGDLLRAPTPRASRHQHPTLSTRMSEFDRRLVVTSSLSAVTDTRRA